MRCCRASSGWFRRIVTVLTPPDAGSSPDTDFATSLVGRSARNVSRKAEKWSGWRDSNPRPLDPQPAGDCVGSRFTESFWACDCAIVTVWSRSCRLLSHAKSRDRWRPRRPASRRYSHRR
jgi:hypothetical protein